MGVFGREAVRVLVHVERADEYRTGETERSYDAGVLVCGRALAVDLRAGKRHDAGDVEEILYRKRDAGQGPGIAARRNLSVNARRVRERLIRKHRGKAVESPSAEFDPCKRRFHRRRRAQSPNAHLLGDRVCALPIHAHGSNRVAWSTEEIPAASIASAASSNRLKCSTIVGRQVGSITIPSVLAASSTKRSSVALSRAKGIPALVPAERQPFHGQESFV